MSRKQFIETNGATCSNWTWSWSFVNHAKKFVIFGLWDIHDNGSYGLIFSNDWQYNSKGRKQAAFDQSRQHIGLVEEEGYSLFTFPIIFSGSEQDELGNGPSKIGGFSPDLTERQLLSAGPNWYAVDNLDCPPLPEETNQPERFVEGATRTVSVNAHERNREARQTCLQHYGHSCRVCEFNFAQTYGPLGQGYIHVHHLVPLATITEQYVVNPIDDLIPVCPNCHAMIHRTEPPQSIDDVKRLLKMSH